MAAIYRIRLLTSAVSARAQVPGLLRYQARLTTGGTHLDGPAQFKVALVNRSGTVALWSNTQPIHASAFMRSDVHLRTCVAAGANSRA